MIGVVCLCVAIVIAWLLTRKLIVPIKSAQHGVARLASGHYGEQIQHTYNDELGSLLNDVNLLSTILAENRSAKNRWFANISHELRTPLTVLSGELEAMQAGIKVPWEKEADGIDAVIEKFVGEFLRKSRVPQHDRGDRVGLACDGEARARHRVAEILRVLLHPVGELRGLLQHLKDLHRCRRDGWCDGV